MTPHRGYEGDPEADRALAYIRSCAERGTPGGFTTGAESACYDSYYLGNPQSAHDVDHLAQDPIVAVRLREAGRFIPWQAHARPRSARADENTAPRTRSP